MLILGPGIACAPLADLPEHGLLADFPRFERTAEYDEAQMLWLRIATQPSLAAEYTAIHDRVPWWPFSMRATGEAAEVDLPIRFGILHCDRIGDQSTTKLLLAEPYHWLHQHAEGHWMLVGRSIARYMPLIQRFSVVFARGEDAALFRLFWL